MNADPNSPPRPRDLPRRRIGIGAVGALLAVAVAGCGASPAASGSVVVGGASERPEVPFHLGAEVQRSVPPASQAVALHVGDRLIITVNGNAGFSAPTPAISSPAGRVVLVVSGDDPPEFHFYALRSGTATITFPACPGRCARPPLAVMHVAVADVTR